MSNEKRTAYSEKLRDPRWQKLRLKILERDKWQCQICGDNESTLNVHHRWYTRGGEPWDADESQLVTLCEECHKREGDERTDAEAELMHEMRRRFFASDVTSIAIMFHYLPHDVDVPDEVLLTALSRYLCSTVNCQAIVDWYFEKLGKQEHGESGAT